MGKRVAFRDASRHLKIFSCYLQIDFSTCRQMMFEYFTKGEENLNKLSDKRRQINDWWIGIRKPQTTQIQDINAFFKEVSKQKTLSWDDNWLYQSLPDLAKVDCLDYAYERVMEPFALQRFFKFYYAKTNVLNTFTNEYCQPLAKNSSIRQIPKYYLLYRRFTRDNSLVCDLLKIIEPDEEKMFCSFYQYTDQDIEDPVYSSENITNLRRYHGNVFFNRNCVNVSCASIANGNEDGTDYVHLLFQRFSSKKSVSGLIMGLGDSSRQPVCIPFVIKRHYPQEKIKIETHINDIVRKVDPDFGEYQNIIKELNQSVSINKNAYLGLKQK